MAKCRLLQMYYRAAFPLVAWQMQWQRKFQWSYMLTSLLAPWLHFKSETLSPSVMCFSKLIGACRTWVTLTALLRVTILGWGRGNAQRELELRRKLATAYSLECLLWLHTKQKKKKNTKKTGGARQTRWKHKRNSEAQQIQL